jgi:predicted permease
MRYALRQLAANPGVTIVALITFALGIGVNTTAFTVLNRLMLQSLPFRDPATIVQIWSMNPRWGREATAPADYFDECEQSAAFSGVAAYMPDRSVSYSEQGKTPVQVGALYMTDNFFSVLGVQPQLGRTPSHQESKSMAPVCLISDAFWRQNFGANPNILGHAIRMNSRPSTIIGVMPPALNDPALFNNRPSIFYLDPVIHSRTVRQAGWYQVVARLKPGVSIKQAQEQVNVLGRRLAQDYPQTNKDRTYNVLPYPTNQLGDEGARLTWMTLALSGLVLVIACINLANLQLVRTTRRSHEIAVRLALGCSRWRLIRLILSESFVISILGGVLGIVAAIWSNAYVARYFQIDMPVNLKVIGFTFLVSLVTGAAFGAFPAWTASRVESAGALKSGGRGSTSLRAQHWTRQSLVVIQLAMALTLLSGAGFFIGGIFRLTHRPLGWDNTHEVLGIITLDQDHYWGAKNQPRVLAFADQALAALNAIPGVEAASLSSGSPAWGSRMEGFRIEGQPEPEKGKAPLAGYFSVSPGWFKVYGMTLVEGREFTAADRADSARVAIVDESLARKIWPGQSAIGKRIGDSDTPDPKWAEIVGVMKDFKGGAEFFNTHMNTMRFVRPWAQDNYEGRGLTMAVRTAGVPGPIKEPLRKTIAQLLPDLALDYLATIEEDTASTFSYFTFLRRVLVQMAGLGLLLSAVGIYGVVANLTSERTKEIGIRMALGAQPHSVVWLFLRNGLWLATIGVVIGLFAAFALVATLSRLIPALPGNDPFMISAAAVILVSVALLACWLPARKTTRIDPTIALRAD